MRDQLIKIKPGIYYLACFAIILLPLKYLFYWFISVSVHEIFHYLAVRCSGVRVYRVTIGMSGVEMNTDSMTNIQELICAAAGPLGGILMFFLTIKFIPLLAILSLGHSVYNLIPLFPSDGGRVLRGIIKLIFKGSRGDLISIWLERFFTVLLVGCAFYCTFKLRLGIIPLLVAVSMIFKNKKIKCS